MICRQQTLQNEFDYPEAQVPGVAFAMESRVRVRHSFSLLGTGIYHRLMRTFLFLLLGGALAQAQWTPQTSGTTASLRGISAVSGSVAWASGSGGTVLRTTDQGKTWQLIAVPQSKVPQAKVPQTEALDFRAIRAFDENTAFVMSVGSGESSRIYKTADGGAHWDLSLQNKDPKGFFDAIAFWNPNQGVIMGDPVDGHIYVATTKDGGESWQPVDAANLPAARPGEGAFAASGTCLVTRPDGLAWIATGGTGGARVYRSTDWGHTWKAVETSIRHDGDASGIFSLAFCDTKHGIAVGGNYSKPVEDTENVALTEDSGVSWSAPTARPKGYRSGVACVPGANEWIATGTTGTDVSKDGGASWIHLSDEPFNAMSFAGSGYGWAVGPKGAIARLASSSGE
jgi:photosystem II stability/assembly factor-like uncharacterized protein